MANRYPLVFDVAAGNKIKELPTGDNLNLLGNSIVDAVNISASGTIVANGLTVNNLTVGSTPISTLAKTGDWADIVNKPTLFSGDYNDLTNKPSVQTISWANVTDRPFVATKLSQLVNDVNFASSNTLLVNATQVNGLATVAKTGSFTDLTNVPNFVTAQQIAGGTLTIDVNNTGNLEGSVIATDGTTVLIDADRKWHVGDLITYVNYSNPSNPIVAGLQISGTQIVGSTVSIGHNIVGNTFESSLVEIVSDEISFRSAPERTGEDSTTIIWPANELKLSELGGLEFTVFNLPEGLPNYGGTTNKNFIFSVGNDGSLRLDAYGVDDNGDRINGHNIWKIEDELFSGNIKGDVYGADSSIIVDSSSGIVTGTFQGTLDGDLARTGELNITATNNIVFNTTGQWKVNNPTAITMNPTGSWSVTASDASYLENTTGNLRVEALGGDLQLKAAGPVTITSDPGDSSSSSIVVSSSGITFNGTVSGLVVNTGNEAYHNFAPTTTTVNLGNAPVASGSYLQTDEGTPVDIEATITASTGYTKSRIELNASVQNFTDSTTEMQIDLVRLVNGANETVLKSLIFPAANTFYGSQSFLHIDTHGASVGDTVTYKLKVNMSGYSNESARLVTGICGDTLFVKEIA